MRDYGIYINGAWRASEGGEIFETVDPCNGEVLARFPAGTREDVDRAVEAARSAFKTWSRTPAPKRGLILLEAARLLRERKQELGTLVSREMGKVIAEGLGDVQEGIDFFEYMAAEGRRLFGETTTSELREKFCMSVRRPIGVVGMITPWNFPIAIPTWKLGGALVCGNTVVFKPASLTPLCMAKLVEVFEDAGLPPGVLNMVTGSGGTVGTAIVEHPEIRVVSFTGGVPTGREIYTRAAKTLKHVGLELGGKNPIIVMEDANLDLALEGVLFGAFGTAGQRCTATSRLLIQEEVYDELLGMLVERAKKLRLGDPTDPTVDVGPLSCREQEQKILEYIEIGKAEGARLVLGGRKLLAPPLDKGFFIEPTIFEAEHGMRITKEEIFGPVLSVIRFKDYEEGVRIANGVEYGLSSSIYTSDVRLAFRAIEDLEAGITYINAPTIGAEVHLPFGGVKNTGNGHREAGSEAVRTFTELKAVYIDYSGRLQKAQIDRVE
ncbi:MAG: aldehyde dehydrogenase family protein [Candidatus Thermoplasmatota archaeon]